MKRGQAMLRKRNLYITILLVLCSIFIVSNVAAADNITVAVSQSRVMTFSGVERVAIANPEIADVVVISATEVLLVGKSPGTTTLHIWSNEIREMYQVEVVADDASIANEIKSIIGFDDLKVSKIGKTIILEGKVNSQYQKARAEKVAEAYGEKVVNLLEMTKPLQVKIEAKIIEISKAKSTELGIKWGNDPSKAGTFQFGQSPNPNWTTTRHYITPNGDDASVSGNTWNQAIALSGGAIWGQQWGALGGFFDINAQLNALINQGAAKVLSQPYMVTISGESGSILIGGQIPIPISNSNGSITVEWKEYGIKLDVTPEVNSEGLINGKVKAEVSALDWSSDHQITLGANLKIPPLTTRRAETTIALSSGQTMAIGGLYSRVDSTNITKLPFLGDLPILGALFTSKSFAKDETELIILVTPTIINPAEYLPRTSLEMKEFIKEDPVGGTQNGGKNKNTNR